MAALLATKSKHHHACYIMQAPNCQAERFFLKESRGVVVEGEGEVRCCWCW